MLTAAVFVNHTFECSAIFTMEKLVEQRVCLKFCVSNDISCAESLKMLQKTYGESCMSKTQAYEWYKAFKEDREVIIDLPRSGRLFLRLPWCGALRISSRGTNGE